MANSSGKLIIRLHGVHRMSLMSRMASSIEIPARRLSKNPLIGAPANSDKPLPNTAVNGLNSIKFIRKFSGLNNNGVGSVAQRQFHSTPHSQYSAGSAAQVFCYKLKNLFLLRFSVHSFLFAFELETSGF